jgi:ribosomal protein S18 acetylase RimI-like enzyme
MKARWAGPDDVDELIRLREVMSEAMGTAGDPSWRPVVEQQLRDGLVNGRYFAAVVAADGGPGLAGGGVGMVWERLAGPSDDGRLGYIQSMATDPRFRGLGVARSVLALLMAGFRERGVRKIGLHYTPDGEPLYRSVGFVEPGQPELRYIERS